MKLSQLYIIEAAWTAFRHDEGLLERVRAARSGSDMYGALEITLGQSKLLCGAFDEPHDLERCSALTDIVLGLVEQYLAHTLSATRRDLAAMGVDVDG